MFLKFTRAKSGNVIAVRNNDVKLIVERDNKTSTIYFTDGTKEHVNGKVDTLIAMLNATYKNEPENKC